MKKIVVPTILILMLGSIVLLLVAKEYSKQKHDEAMARLTQQKEEEIISESVAEGDDPVVSGNRLKADDTCLVTGKNTAEKTITLRNIKGGEDKTLEYDGTTSFTKKHGSPMTASEVQVGDIVDITFTTFDKKLQSVSQSQEAWENRNVTKFAIDEKGKTITIADDLYRLAKNYVIASNDKQGKLLDVTSLDSITVKGIGKDVYSIQVESGHGYIRVKNDAYFVGGWIEIGQDIITVLTEGMLIPVHEGTYDVKVTNKGYLGRETVTVERDKETKLDLSKIEIEEVAIGHVMFSIWPDFAQLYVDGLMTDFEERVALEYGIHSIRVESPGYETVRANIRVGSEMANIAIELDESEEDVSSSGSSSSSSSSDSSSSSSTESSSSSSSTSTSSSSASSSSNSSSSSTSPSSSSMNSSTILSDTSVISDNKKFYVEGPQGVEVYLDGTYIGIAPCSTVKIAGTHTITLAKAGYDTKSYTINVGNDGKDLTMSFSELIATQR